MRSMYRVKEFSELTGVTVRTLHYYDEIGLVQPSEKTDTGHRLYSEDDLMKVQYISTLKFIGYSLNQIKTMISQADIDIADSLALQSDTIAKRIEKFQQAHRLTQQAMTMLKRDNKINWRNIGNIIKLLEVESVDPDAWLRQLLTDEELARITALDQSRTQEEKERFGQHWAELFAEVRPYAGGDPQGEDAQRLVKKWWKLFEETYKNCLDIGYKLCDAMKVGAVPENVMPFYDKRVHDYMHKAVIYMLSDVLRQPIDDLELSAVTLENLKVSDINCIGALVQYIPEDLVNFPNITEESLIEIREALLKRHLNLGVVNEWPPVAD